MHRTIIIGFSALFALAACGDQDSDGDGLLDSEEEELGTDPENADSDGDGMKDGWEVNIGLDPNNSDTDGDGVDDGTETREGTDPTNTDTDGDGYDDGAEYSADSDPLNPMSYALEEGDYRVGDCQLWPEDVEGETAGPTYDHTYSYGGQNYSWTTYQEGDLVDNEVLFDSYGQDFPLWSQCGNTVLLAVGAEWCPPCQDKAEELTAIFEEYSDYDWTPVEVLMEDSRGNQSEVDDLQRWKETYELDRIPVVAPSDYDQYIDFYTFWDRDFGIPSLSVIGPDLRVMAVDDYWADANIESYLTE